jgi:NAD(P)-dependent dehydrogenase (short-subunit alcohol dehydrogenase family)
MTTTTVDSAKLFSLTGRKAIIMGVGALGRMAAATLTSAGSSVLLVDREAALEHQETKALREQSGEKVECFAMLPNDQQSATAMVEGALDRLGGLDILVITAGNNIVATPSKWRLNNGMR